MPIEQKLLETSPKNYELNDTRQRLKARSVMSALAITAALGAGSAQAAHAETEVTLFQLPSLEYTQMSSALDVQATRSERQKEQRRCVAQERQDQYQFTSCEYRGAYVSIVKKFPKWSNSHHLSPPGQEDKVDRKKAYFKTHPKEYQRYRLEIAAGINYQSPRAWVWERVNDNECNDTWDCNTGNGYYGGLQMDRGFQRTYNPVAYHIWGTANNWSKEAQELAADRAYDGYGGFGARGLGPWPSSNSELGTYPTPIR